MIEQGLFQLVTADSGVSALVGNKMYWVLAPKGGVIPYIVATRVATSDIYTMAGTTSLRNTLIHLNCFATDYYSSRAIAKAVRNVLQNYHGTLPDTNATVTKAVFTEMDYDQQYEEGGKGFVFQAMLEFRMWYIES